jgi:hypothetical protein
MTMKTMSRSEKIEWAHLVDEIVIEARKGSVRARNWFSSPTWLKIKNVAFTEGRIAYIEQCACVRKVIKERDKVKPKPGPKARFTPEELKERQRVSKLAYNHRLKAERAAKKVAQVVPTVIRDIVWPSDKGVSHATQTA